MDSVRAGQFGQLFRPDNFVFGENLIELAIIHFFLLSTTLLENLKHKKKERQILKLTILKLYYKAETGINKERKKNHRE